MPRLRTVVNLGRYAKTIWPLIRCGFAPETAKQCSPRCQKCTTILLLEGVAAQATRDITVIEGRT